MKTNKTVSEQIDKLCNKIFPDNKTAWFVLKDKLEHFADFVSCQAMIDFRNATKKKKAYELPEVISK